MQISERIARGVYRLILVFGLLMAGGVFIAAIVELFSPGSTEFAVGEWIGIATGTAAGTYVLALLVRWIIRGFGSDE